MWMLSALLLGSSLGMKGGGERVSGLHCSLSPSSVPGFEAMLLQPWSCWSAGQTLSPGQPHEQPACLCLSSVMILKCDRNSKHPRSHFIPIHRPPQQCMYTKFTCRFFYKKPNTEIVMWIVSVKMLYITAPKIYIMTCASIGNRNLHHLPFQS